MSRWSGQLRLSKIAHALTPPIGLTGFQRLRLVLFVGVLMGAFWLRVADLETEPPGVSGDESVDVLDAFHISHTWYYPFYEDFGRPEPLSRYFLAVGALLWGPGVWSARLVDVFVGVVTVALAGWAMRECLSDLDPRLRWLCGLIAAAALSVAINHIVLSRAIYRGIFQPMFMFVFLGFLLRGLRTNRRRHFVIAGIGLAGALYSYTAALALPLAIAAVGFSLLCFRRAKWRTWLPNLVLLVLVFGFLMIPVGLRFLNRPGAVIGRAADVSQSQNYSYAQRIVMLWGGFYNAGDGNPQYNVERAPLLPPVFNLLFALGLVALALRVRQPSSVLILAFLVLAALPVLATDEVPHGLRISGEFAAFPLIVGLGGALILLILRTALRLLRFKIEWLGFAAAVIGLIVLVMNDQLYARQVYLSQWATTNTIVMYDVKLPVNGWFFRTDRRDLGRWLSAQTDPLLVPVDELNQSTTRTWLLRRYPNVHATGTPVSVPAGTKVVVPWSLEIGDLRRASRIYALLQGDTITLLPPLSVESHAALVANIDAAQAIQQADGRLLARVAPLRTDQALTFEPYTAGGQEDQPLTIFENQAEVIGWRGPDTLSPGKQRLIYILDWSTRGRLWHQYNTFLQLLSQAGAKIAGDDASALDKLYPTTLWRPGDLISEAHSFTVDSLAPGAYRLVAGMYVYVDQRLSAFTAGGDPVGNSPTLGWIKVPQPGVITIPSTALSVNATLADKIALRSATAVKQDATHLKITLYWEALAARPAFDATIFVHVLDQNENPVVQQDARPWDGQYPTFIWDKGEIVQTDHILDLKGADPKSLRLEVGMYTFPNLDRLPVTQNGQPAANGVIKLGSLADLLAGA